MKRKESSTCKRKEASRPHRAQGDHNQAPTSKEKVFKLCKNYVIFLGGGGEVTKRLHKRGGGIHQKITLDYKGGSIWFYPSIDKVSKKIQILLVKINILRYNTKKNIY